MKKRFVLVSSLLVLSISLLLSGNLPAQAPAVWSACSACHTIGGGKKVGPDLKGVTQKRSEDWLRHFIRNSQEFMKADADAKAIFDEFKIPMPPHDLSDAQMKDLLAYLKNDGKMPAEEKAAAAKPVEAPAEWSACAACHTIGGGKKVGPDLKGVTKKRSKEWLHNFIRNSQEFIKTDADAKAIFDEFKIPMPAHDLTDAQIDGILNYIENYKAAPAAAPEQAATTTEAPAQTSFNMDNPEEFQHIGPGNNTWKFIIAVIVLLVFLFDLFITKIIKWNWVHIVAIFTALWFMYEIGYAEAAALGRQQGYSPDQPIWFSHQVHAGQNQIDCLYCHSTATESRHAGIPSVNVCLNCHNVVKKGKRTGTKEIAKIFEAEKSGKPIEWIKVHNLPDHVYFSHAQHVNAGKVACQECHGAVEKMNRIVQVAPLSMGWCLDCHRTKGVQFKDNDYYKSFKKYHDEIKAGKRSKVTVEDIGGTDCSACHY